MGFFDYINPKAAPSLCRGPFLQLFDSQGPKLFLGFFCNSLQILRPLGPLIPCLLMVQNNFWTHLGLGPSLTKAQQPFKETLGLGFGRARIDCRVAARMAEGAAQGRGRMAGC